MKAHEHFPEFLAFKTLIVEVLAIVEVLIEGGVVVTVRPGDGEEFVLVEGAVLSEIGQIEQALDEALRMAPRVG